MIPLLYQLSYAATGREISYSGQPLSSSEHPSSQD